MEKQGQKLMEAGGGCLQREQVACNYHLGEWGSKHTRETRMAVNVESPRDRRDWRFKVRPDHCWNVFFFPSIASSSAYAAKETAKLALNRVVF